ncbi:hypothetical protein [Bradyrhizobium arachidis]|uniref:Uncharacterized protein n=1 Tax=Bradyrhizobium arachidis TaxID=858423 RepID=A0AAE7NMQ0_9BRAD|nr:hypothetical protein [Bradyrhizobium arachidis]QOZ68091.1 hypothetical protein WN72_18565 [Bradyrhizobium arachidis]SFV12973.1 hypothetical protein SAMN05192541_11967 [Bradyrhizobium arachidis]
MIITFVTRIIHALVLLATRAADNMNRNLMAPRAPQHYLMLQGAARIRRHQRRASDERGH